MVIKICTMSFRCVLSIHPSIHSPIYHISIYHLFIYMFLFFYHMFVCPLSVSLHIYLSFPSFMRYLNLLKLMDPLFIAMLIRVFRFGRPFCYSTVSFSLLRCFVGNISNYLLPISEVKCLLWGYIYPQCIN